MIEVITLLDAVKKMEKILKAQAVANFEWPDRVTVRFKTETGKSFRPFHRTTRGWLPGNPPKPLALYGSEVLPDNTLKYWVRPTGKLARLAKLAPIWVPEGEAKCDFLQLIGLQSVTSGSASSHKMFDWSPLVGRDAILLPDNDVPGDAYAEGIARFVVQWGGRAKIVHIPGLPVGGDVIDWALALGVNPRWRALLNWKSALLDCAAAAPTMRAALQAWATSTPWWKPARRKATT